MQRARGISATVFVALLAAASGAIITSASPDAVAQTAQATTARIVAAAQALTSTLDDAQRSHVQFPFDSPQRARWSNLPSGIFQREGLRMGDLTAPQREAVMNLLAAALSADGFAKSRASCAVMSSFDKQMVAAALAAEGEAVAVLAARPAEAA